MLIRLFFLVWNVLLLIWGTCALIRQGRGIWRFILIGMAHASAALGLAGMAWSTHLFPTLIDDPCQTILYALPPALALAATGAFVSIWMQRRTNPLGTINPFLPSAVLALILAGTALTASGWRLFGNGWLDASEARAKLAIVLRIHENVTLMRWENGEEFELHGVDPVHVEPGGRVMVQVKPGYHGMEWVAGVAAASPD